MIIYPIILLCTINKRPSGNPANNFCWLQILDLRLEILEDTSKFTTRP
jgi:hypothetical protein